MSIVVDTSKSPFAKLRPVAVGSVTLSDLFWEPRREINRTTTLLSQFDHLETTQRLDNFRRASGRKTGIDFVGLYPFNDSDVYKWLEAAATELPRTPELAPVIEIAEIEIEAAQQPDGYLNTYFMFERAGQRWKDLARMHELYCAGHFFQAAVAHYHAAGSERMLNVARRFADYIAATFGPDKHPGTCGHEEVEMALVELYRATGEQAYLDTAAYFIDARGQEPSALSGTPYFDRRYIQDHIPYRDLDEVTGHAVRMMYLAVGAADVYLETGDESLMTAMLRQWENMTERRSYVSGGVGARHDGEAFGKDYELPNARAYTETCAAIGSVMWNHRLLAATADARYADLIEHTLYNAVLPGLSLDGKQYFYENPLADDGTHRRQEWFGCACCPPNVARLLAQLPAYFYGVTDAGDIHMHLYAAGSARIPLPTGGEVALKVETDYPWDGKVLLTVTEASKSEFGLALRVPAWAEGATIQVNLGVSDAVTPGTYALQRRIWQSGDSILLNLPMSPRYVACHPYVEENTGRVAVFNGPILYCAEVVDNPDFANLQDGILPSIPDLKVIENTDLPGIPLLTGSACIIPPPSGSLYGPPQPTASTGAATITLVPYYAWANREPGQMLVWLRRDQ